MSLLSQSSWWVLNKELTRKYGLDSSYLLSDLIQRSDYFRSHNLLPKDKYFFTDQETIENDTSLSPYRQRIAIKKLEELGVISIQKRGVPQRFFYKINEKIINKLIISLSIK